MRKTSLTVMADKRRRKVEEMLCLAMSNREMATELGIQTRTVKNYLNQMYREYGITSGVRRVKLAVLLFRQQLEQRGNEALRDHEAAVEAHMVGGDGRDTR